LALHSVMPGTPAEAAGLKRSDIIIRIDGRKFRDINGFRQIINSKQAGDRFELTLLRNGSRQTVKVKTGAVPAVPAPVMQAKQPAEFEWLGADITPLVAAVVPYEKTGVYVADVEGILAAAGVRAGDIIKGVNNNPVTDMDSFIKLSRKVDVKKGFLLDIKRAGNPVYITVKG